MNCFGESACLALALASIVGAAAADEDQAQAGREVLDQRCRNCHGGTAPADYPILRALYEQDRRRDLSIVAINDLAEAKTNVHLARYETSDSA